MKEEREFQNKRHKLLVEVNNLLLELIDYKWLEKYWEVDTDDYNIEEIITKNLPAIQKYWAKFPRLNFGNVLTSLQLLPQFNNLMRFTAARTYLAHWNINYREYQYISHNMDIKFLRDWDYNSLVLIYNSPNIQLYTDSDFKKAIEAELKLRKHFEEVKNTTIKRYEKI